MSRRGRPPGAGRGSRKRDAGNGFEEWGGYMSAKIRKLQEQFVEKGTAGNISIKSNIFKGVAIFVNGYTDPTSDELKKLMLAHGGVYHDYYSRSYVTHIIATNLPNSKVAALTDQKVVKPAWILDSLKAGRQLSHEPYLLYTTQSRVQPGLLRYASSSSSTASSSNSLYTHEQNKDNARASSDLQHNEKDDLLEHDTSEVDVRILNSTQVNEKSASSECVVKSPDKSVASSDTVDTVQNNDHEMFSGVITSPVGPGGHNKSTTKPYKAIPATNDQNFVSEFYAHSRLHHISTWGAEFKQYVTQLQSVGTAVFPGRAKLKQLAENSFGGVKATQKSGRPQRTIMHVDMDSFFVSVGLRNRPDLIGKPVAVTHSKGKGPAERPGTDIAYEQNHYSRKGLDKTSPAVLGNAEHSTQDVERNPDLLKMNQGDQLTVGVSKALDSRGSMAEIASCSYEARQTGLKNGMFLGAALKLCPDLQTIPYDFEGYQTVSKQLYDMVARYTHDIEAVSCDEMFVDLTDLLNDTGIKSLQFATLLRDEIKRATHCNASVGIGPNILLARMATRVAKPNGQHEVHADEGLMFISNKSIADLPGVGRTLTNRLNAMQIKTCGDLQLVPLGTLQSEFGPKTGQALYQHCRGQDERQICMEKERKSVSAEINYGIRFTMTEEVEKFLTGLAEEVHNRLTKVEKKGKTITLKVKVRKEGAPKETAKFLGHGVCDNVAKSTTLPMATDNTDVIARECLSLARQLQIPPSDYRGIGIQVSRLEGEPGQVNKGARLQSILNFTVTKDIKQKNTVSNQGNTCKTVPKEISSAACDAQPPISVANSPVKVQCREREFNLPPLPSLSILSSPDSSYKAPSSTLTSTPPAQRTGPSTSNTQASDFLLPSPSQVDPDVLSELPEDIRRQIEQAMSNSSKSAQSNPVAESVTKKKKVPTATLR